LAVRAAKVTNIILREAMGLDNPFRAVLKFYQIGRGSVDSIRSTRLPHPMMFLVKISHGFV